MPLDLAQPFEVESENAPDLTQPYEIEASGPDLSKPFEVEHTSASLQAYVPGLHENVRSGQEPPTIESTTGIEDFSRDYLTEDARQHGSTPAEAIASLSEPIVNVSPETILKMAPPLALLGKDVSLGVAQGISEIVSGMTSPASLATVAASTVAPELVVGILSVMGAKTSGEKAGQAIVQWRVGNKQEAARLWTESAGGAAQAMMAPVMKAGKMVAARTPPIIRQAEQSGLSLSAATARELGIGENIEAPKPDALEPATINSKEQITETVPIAPAPEPEPIPSLPTHIVTAIEEQANRSRQRLSGKLLSPTPEDLYDMSVIGAAHLTRLAYEGGKGVVDFAKWSADMLADVGDKVRPDLELVYDRSKALLNDADRLQQKAVTSQAQRIIERDEALARPKEEQPAFDVTKAAERGSEVMQDVIREKGQFDPKAWSEQMLNEYGTDVRSESVLEDLYKQSRDLMTEGTPVPERSNPTPFSVRSASITVSEKAALREVLSKAEASGEAGRQAGQRAAYSELKPVMDELRDRLSESISKAEALNVYLKGQEKGSAIGAGSARSDLEMADRWLEATSRDIRGSLIKLADSVLPSAERGRFMRRIGSATERPSILSPDPSAMFRKAAKLAGEIEYHAGEVLKSNLQDSIEALGKRASNSLGVELRARQAAQELLRDYHSLKGDMSHEMLQSFWDRLHAVHEVGRMAQDVKLGAWQAAKRSAMGALQDSTATPIEARPEFRPTPGEKSTLTQKLRNAVVRTMNIGGKIDVAIMPIDAFMGLADRGYSGFLARTMRGPVDNGFNLHLNELWRRTAAPEKLARKLNEQNFQRIGVHAIRAQEGGLERLGAMGLDEKFVNELKLTPEEKAFYDAARRSMDELLPLIQEVKRRVDNVEVVPEENYWPMQRDWRIYEQPVEEMTRANALAQEPAQAVNWEPLEKDFHPRQSAKSKQGFTQERQEGAKTPIKLNAWETYSQHMQDATYYVHMAEPLKMAAEIARSEEFKAKYGGVGQRVILDWIDTVARQGGVYSYQRIRWLDTLRRNISKGAIGFRLVSGIVHTSNWPLAYARIGNWFTKGILESASTRGQTFLRDNFAESFARGGGEPGQVEAETSSVSKAAFALPRMLDRIGAQAISLGAYMKALSDKGLDASKYDSLPLDRTAIQEARILARRAVASPLAKDVSQSLSRGALTGSNVSAGRSLFHFQNIFQDIWSNARVDLWELGIKERNAKIAATTALGLIAATIVETGIRHAGVEAMHTISGEHPKREESYGHRFLKDALRRVPFMGQIMTQMLYGETGVPVLDTIAQTSKSAYTLAAREITPPTPKTMAQKKKMEQTTRRAAIKTAKGVTSIAGVPGSGQALEVLEAATK